MGCGDEFCGDCGASRAEPAAAETPEALLTYHEALTEFWSDGVLEDWEAEELERLREELGIRPATHARLEQEVRGTSAAAAPLPVRLSLDEAAAAEFRAGHSCQVRLQVENLSDRLVKQFRIACRLGELALEELSTKVVGPKRNEVVSAGLVAERAGQVDLKGYLSATDMRGQRLCYRLRPVGILVAGAAPGSSTQVMNIDASGMRVADLSGMQKGPASARGGVIAERWVPLVLVGVPSEEFDKNAGVAAPNVEVKAPWAAQVAELMSSAAEIEQRGNWAAAVEHCEEALLLEPEREDAKRFKALAEQLDESKNPQGSDTAGATLGT